MGSRDLRPLEYESAAGRSAEESPRDEAEVTGCVRGIALFFGILFSIGAAGTLVSGTWESRRFVRSDRPAEVAFLAVIGGAGLYIGVRLGRRRKRDT